MLSAVGVLGISFILHSIYSIREFVHHHKALGDHAPAAPKDIIVEVLLGVLLVIIGAVWSNLSDLKPLALAEEHAAQAANGDNQYQLLESRPHFQDLISRRKAYLEWRRQTATESSTATK